SRRRRLTLPSRCIDSRTSRRRGIPPRHAGCARSRSRVTPSSCPTRWRCAPAPTPPVRSSRRATGKGRAPCSSASPALPPRRLKQAWQLFLDAGPYAGDRREATDRTAMLALLQQVPGDTFPELGRALLTLARGDSGRAVDSLRLAATRLSGTGRPDILLLAARIAAHLGLEQQRTAVALCDEVVRTGGTGAASCRCS